MAFIEIRHLGKTFGNFRALKDINLDIAEKEFITFLGPSGCGKTTMLRTLAGFIAPDQGTIRVNGHALSSPAGTIPPEQRRMGMVFQNYAVWPHMTVFENVAFGLEIAKVDRGQVGKGSRASWQPLALLGSSSAIRANSLAASSNGWRWHGR